MQGQVDDFIDATQAEGRYAFDVEELRSTVSLSLAGVKAALRRLEERGRIVRPSARRGFFVIVPLEYHSLGAPPSAWWLDQFMRYIDRPDYYVGLLTAAEWHGSAHYAVQETQVVVSEQLRPVKVGRERINFVTNSCASRTPTESKAFDAGSVRVSTPEGTAVDVVRYTRLVGGPSRVATVLSELPLSLPALSQAIESAGDVTAAQRLGFLLQAAGQHAASQAVARYLESREHRTRPLVPGASREDADISAQWGVIVNAPVEVG